MTGALAIGAPVSGEGFGNEATPGGGKGAITCTCR